MTTTDKSTTIIDMIKELEVKKFEIMNKAFYLSQDTYKAMDAGNHSNVGQTSIAVRNMFKEIEKIDKALEALSELESYDYNVTISLVEV